MKSAWVMSRSAVIIKLDQKAGLRQKTRLNTETALGIRLGKVTFRCKVEMKILAKIRDV